MKSRMWRVLVSLGVCCQSGVAQIQLDRITTGEIATEAHNTFGCAWADFDGDGWVDLFLANALGQPNRLYRNNGDGTFSRTTAGPVATDGGDSDCGVWGDLDNDGDLDLYVTNWDPPNKISCSAMTVEATSPASPKGQWSRTPESVLVPAGATSTTMAIWICLSVT